MEYLKNQKRVYLQDFKNYGNSSGIVLSANLVLSQMFISMLFGYAMGIEHVRDLLNLADSLETISYEFIKTFLYGIIKKRL